MICVFAAVLCIALAVPSFAADAVILGGNAFGVRLYGGRLTVVSLEDVRTKDGTVCPAADAGIAPGDEIVAVDGETVESAEEFTKLIGECDGAVELTVRRQESEITLSVTPRKSADDGTMRLGIWVKDSTAGIGTMTFVLPDTLAFGALGHGIGGDSERSGSDADGAVFDVDVESVKRGQRGSPGELRGTFGGEKVGAVILNCEDGVFGVCSAMPDELMSAERIALCPASEVKAGAAKLYCTLGDDGVCSYDVAISDVSGDEDDERSFVVTVTDRRLIERTGGIVQGMSGSPLVQDGRLIGAVTHVLISDPTTGYGIFIDKMLENLPAVLR